MASFIFGEDFLWIDLVFAVLGEVIVAMLILYLVNELARWLYDFNGAMKLYREIKGETNG